MVDEPKDEQKYESFIKKSLSQFQNRRMSFIVDKCMDYVSRGDTPGDVYRRFKNVKRLARHLHRITHFENTRRCAGKLERIFQRKLDVLLMEYIDYWESIGRKDFIGQLLEKNEKLSPTIATYAKHVLMGWDIYIYCRVRFPGSGVLYYYRTELEHICSGDMVLVPTGEENTPTYAQVADVRKYTFDSLPRPLCDTKEILGVEEDDL